LHHLLSFIGTFILVAIVVSIAHVGVALSVLALAMLAENKFTKQTGTGTRQKFKAILLQYCRDVILFDQY
jgi:hypothetical protein